VDDRAPIGRDVSAAAAQTRPGSRCQWVTLPVKPFAFTRAEVKRDRQLGPAPRLAILRYPYSCASTSPVHAVLGMEEELGAECLKAETPLTDDDLATARWYRATQPHHRPAAEAHSGGWSCHPPERLILVASRRGRSTRLRPTRRRSRGSRPCCACRSSTRPRLFRARRPSPKWSSRSERLQYCCSRR
jgi:hypothetical protein